MSHPMQKHQRSQSDSSQESQTRKFHSFIRLFQDLTQHDAFPDAVRTAEEVAFMTARLKQQAETLRELEKDLQTEKKTLAQKISDLETYFAKVILNTHRQEISSRDAQVDKLREELGSARSQLAESRKIAETQVAEYKKLGTELGHAKSRLEGQGKDLETARKAVQDQMKRVKEQDIQIQRDKERTAQIEVKIKSLEGDKHKHKQDQSELQKLRAFSNVLFEDDLSRVKHNFASLWTGYYNVVRDAFSPDLSDSVLMSSAWNNLTSLNQTTYATPLPRSNSPAAKFMRTMVILAFISNRLVSTIFTTTHLVEGDVLLRTKRLNLAAREPDKEGFLRGMLATLPDGRESQNHVSDLVAEVCSVVREVLSPDTATRFSAELEKITTDAASFGVSLRCRRSCFEIDIEDGTDIDWIWRSVSMPDPESQSLPDQRASATDFDSNPAELVVFPKVFSVSHNGPTLIVPGKVLQRSATAIARQEVASMPVRIPSIASRRYARTGNASIHSTGQAPAGNGSFLDSRNGLGA